MIKKIKNPKILKLILSGYLLGSIILILIGIFFFHDLRDIYTNPTTVKGLIKSSEYLGPLVFISLQIFQAVILFIPGQVFTLVGGYLFGTLLGAIYSTTGIMIGSIIVFYLGRKFGRPYFESKFNKEELKKIDEYFNKKGKIGLLISRLTFFFPSDLASFGVSLTNISYRDYILITFIGYTPMIFVMTALGNKMSEGSTVTSLIIFSLLGVLAIIFIFRDLKKLISEIRKMKQEEDE